MPYKLFASRYENNDTSAALLEPFSHVEQAGIRWDIEQFGTDRVEVTVKARNRYDLYDRMNNHAGQRLALYSSYGYRPISGNIVDVEPAGASRLRYTCAGPAWRHDDQLVRETFPTGEDTNERLETLLTDYVDVVSSDYSDIDATSKDAAEFQTQFPRGDYPSEIINEYRGMSDASNNPWDYWCVDEPFNGTSLRQFKPYFKNRNGYTAVDWIVNRRDLSSLKLNRSIRELKSFAQVWYGSFEGTVTTGSGGVTLIDTAANFTGFQVEPGDRVTNITDGSRGKVDSVIGSNQLTLVGTGLIGGTADNFSVNDEYTIERMDAWYKAEATATNAPLTRHWSENNSRWRFEQAQSAANERVTFFGKAVQRTNFVISSPFIRSGSGARWPLWEVIAQGGGVIRVADLYPSISASGLELDSLTTFFITSMDYDYTSNSLTVYVDSRDGRLDARLRRSGIEVPGMVARR